MKQPIPKLVSFRDAFAFAQHVESSAEEAGREVVPEFYQFPVFYYSNHLMIQGEGPVVVHEDHLDRLDFELEVGVVIGKRGKNIPAERAEEHILGLTIINDFSARGIQWSEMRVKLGPAKGKDFATAVGPDLIPLADLERYRVSGPRGSHWDLPMRGFLNGELICSGNLKDMHFTFAEIIERCSYGTELFPGELIGSGTVGTGCFRELNYLWRKKDPEHQDRWLEVGDKIALEVDGLGRLENSIALEKSPWNLCDRKRT